MELPPVKGFPQPGSPFRNRIILALTIVRCGSGRNFRRRPCSRRSRRYDWCGSILSCLIFCRSVRKQKTQSVDNHREKKTGALILPPPFDYGFILGLRISLPLDPGQSHNSMTRRKQGRDGLPCGYSGAEPSKPSSSIISSRTPLSLFGCKKAYSPLRKGRAILPRLSGMKG